MAEDPLDLFKEKAECPVCGCIEGKGSFRCLGCGAFHSTAHLVERDAPPTESRVLDDVEVNPLAYSMGPNQKIVEDEFEQSDDVVSWEGGSTDFSFEDESPIKENINKTSIPESEEL